MPRVLSADEVASLGLEQPASRGPRVLSPDEVAHLGLEEAPTADVSTGESFLRGAGQGATFGFNDEIEGGVQALLRKYVQDDAGRKTLGELYRESRDVARREYRQAEEAHPVASFAGSMLGGAVATAPMGAASSFGKAIAQGAAMGAANGLGASNADLTTGDSANYGRAAFDTALGAGAGAALPAAFKGATALAGRWLPGMQATEQRLAAQLGDKAAKEAEKTAASAAGTMGASRANASRTIERLGMTEGLSAADQAANAAALSTPEATGLASALAAKARTELPDKLAHMQATEALAAQAAADVPVARAAGETVDSAKRILSQRALAQLNRYAIPAVAAGVGAALGGPVGAGIGAAAGRGISPGVRAVVGNLVFSPEARRVAAGAASTQLQRIAMTTPGRLGRYGGILTGALAQGSDAFAAHAYVLGQTDPEFQKLQQKLANEKDDDHGQ